jgi:hypothetical protein
MFMSRDQKENSKCNISALEAPLPWGQSAGLGLTNHTGYHISAGFLTYTFTLICQLEWKKKAKDTKISNQCLSLGCASTLWLCYQGQPPPIYFGCFLNMMQRASIEEEKIHFRPVPYTSPQSDSKKPAGEASVTFFESHWWRFGVSKFFVTSPVVNTLSSLLH